MLRHINKEQGFKSYYMRSGIINSMGNKHNLKKIQNEISFY